MTLLISDSILFFLTSGIQAVTVGQNLTASWQRFGENHC